MIEFISILKIINLSFILILLTLCFLVTTAHRIYLYLKGKNYSHSDLIKLLFKSIGEFIITSIFFLVFALLVLLFKWAYVTIFDWEHQIQGSSKRVPSTK